jgi:hypothetical protein
MRVSNKNAIEYIEEFEPFHASNMFGEWYGVNYVVYSYGYHFPMWVWDSQSRIWIGNLEKYSRSTTRQQSLTRPHQVDKWVDTQSLKSIAEHGLIDYCFNQAQN